MITNIGLNTPGGKPINPPSAVEAGPTDSGEGHSLVNSLRKENEEIKRMFMELQKIVDNQKKEIEALKLENNKIRHADEGSSNVDMDTNNIHPQYETDEEELERETGWIIQKRKGKSRSAKRQKRKAEDSPEYDLPESRTENRTKTEDKIKVKLPPPINIVGINDVSKVKEIMNATTNKEYKITALNNDVWKINTQDSDSYRELANKLNAEHHQWYTYEDKGNRPIKVMARGLHSTCKREDIIEDLELKGFKIKDAVNIIKKEKKSDNLGNTIYCKRGLPLFMLTFCNKENIDKIYNIRAILHMRVRIEPLRKVTKLIPQCRRCQGYNHTTKYCHRDARCVKCAGKHLTSDCTMKRDSQPKCVNCGEIHPANYRGCEVAKELQKIRNNRTTLRGKKENPPANPIAKKIYPKQMLQKPQENKSNGQKTYAQVAQLITPMKENQNQLAQTLENISKSLEIINKRLDDSDKKVTGIISWINLQKFNEDPSASKKSKTKSKFNIF